MATRIEIDYDRQHANAEVQAIIARSTVSINVLEQLGVNYQALPGYAMAAYQAETNALETLVTALQALLDQIRPLLIEIDGKAGPLDDKNKGVLRALQGLLKNDADLALLDQITGPTPQGGGSPTPPPPGP